MEKNAFKIWRKMMGFNQKQAANYLGLRAPVLSRYERDLSRPSIARAKTLATKSGRMANKYHAIKVRDDGFTFDSKGEHKRYCELKQREKAGEIEGIQVHPVFKAKINNILVCKIELDFQYYDKQKNKIIYEDFKGVYTAISRLKHKLLRALYPQVDLQIVRAE